MKVILLSALALMFSSYHLAAQSLRDKVEHKYADNNGVKLHYVELGEGPLIVMIHGFPDFWYTWRHQMEVLSDSYRVVAMDLRGYNRSDKPEGTEPYKMKYLVEDVAAVIRDAGEESAIIVAHDWGAGIAWNLALTQPDIVKKLAVLSIPHPNNSKTPDIDFDGSYADRFVSKEYRSSITAAWFSGWVTDPGAKTFYTEAFNRSDVDAMLNYYRMNFPTTENLANKDFVKGRTKLLPNAKMPILVIHGEKDRFAPSSGHNRTWDFVENDLLMYFVNDVGHFIQDEAPEKVSEIIQLWLKLNP